MQSLMDKCIFSLTFMYPTRYLQNIILHNKETMLSVSKNTKNKIFLVIINPQGI